VVWAYLTVADQKVYDHQIAVRFEVGCSSHCMQEGTKKPLCWYIMNQMGHVHTDDLVSKKTHMLFSIIIITEW
jgi:hypothetical protein